MPHSDSDLSRTDLDFGWVSDLPTYTDLLPISTTSLLSKLSFFSLYRSSRYSLPRADQLEPLLSLALHAGDPPTVRDATKALTALSDYVSLLKTSSSGLDGARAEEADEWVLRAMEGYLATISIVSCVTFFAESADTTDLGATIPQSLRGLFTIHAHYVGSSRVAVTSWLDKISANLIAAPHAPIEADDGRNHLVPLFAQTRDIIQSLQHAVRASHTKSVGTVAVDDAGRWDKKAGERMDWLRLFANHVRGLGGLESMVKPESGKTERITKKTALAAQREEQERPVRIAIEADLLRCDLAISMATAKIGEVKRRARAEVKEEDVGGGVKEEAGSRKRRALTDESNHGMIVGDLAEWEPVSNLDEDSTGGRKWELEIEMALHETLCKMRGILEERHSDVLTAKIERSDWLDAPTSSIQRGNSPASTSQQSTSDSEDEAAESSSSFRSDDSGSSDDDISHTCPLRTLFRLHDRYEEQRLAVWLSLPSEGRGKMGAYMRGVEGRVGAAWDALGLRLLMEFDCDTLEGYGLSPDKHDKWVELASRKNTKKIRKEGRKTI